MVGNPTTRVDQTPAHKTPGATAAHTRGTSPMARSAATVKTPGATAAKADKPAKAPPSNVEQQAKAHTANGPVDPTKLKNPVFVEDQGWVCPAKPEQITVEATAEVADAEDETEDDET